MTPDETRRSTLIRRSFAWDTSLDRSGWPPPPSFWTEEHDAEIRRNHGLETDQRIIPIQEHGATLDEKYQGLDVLVVGSRCEPNSLEVLMDIGVPRLTLTSSTPPHERRELAIWLTRIERPGTGLRLERRVSLRGEFIDGETVVTDRGQHHTAKEYADLRRRGLDLLDGALHLMGSGGRPADSGDYSPASEARFFSDLGNAVHAAVRAEEKTIGWASVARHGPWSWRTLQKYTNEFKYDLTLFEAEAVRCINHLDTCRFHVRHRAKYKKKWM